MILTTSLLITLNVMFEAAPKECRFRITSGYRTKEHNKKVGGAKNSYHLQKDRAYDIVTNCKEWLIKNAQEKKLTTIEYKTHVHIDNRKNQTCLIRDKSGFRLCKENSLDFSSTNSLYKPVELCDHNDLDYHDM